MTVITVKTAILVSGPLIEISFQLARKFQGSFVLDLHQDLVNRGCQRGETYELPTGGFGAPILPSVSDPNYLSSLILP